MKWWTKAAEGGSIAALTNIATTYYTGLGAPAKLSGGGQMVSSWQRIKAMRTR